VTPPRVSVVVEWDNVRLAGASRARAMLERLTEELLASDARTFEVLLVHDGRPGDVAEAERILEGARAEVRVVSAPGSDYYELKNEGARAARGDLTVFLDCDVVPEPGWLAEMLAPFADPAIDVVAGATHLDEPAGLWSRCLAPTFVFPLVCAPGPIAPVNGFFANNLAFRRETALAFPFPAVEGTSRVSCVALARRLAEADVVVVQNPAARASHPAPLGLRNTVKRALVHGRDTVVLADAGVGPPATARTWMGRVGELTRSVVRDRRTVGLPPFGLPLALAVMVGYYACIGIGGSLARLAPAAARRLDL
jgi:hypothetical protein